jgi:hypothetical protein
MLHSAVLGDLLADEVEAATIRLAGRFDKLVRSGPLVLVELTGTTVGEATIRLDGSRYDGEPFRVAVVDADGSTAPPERWPGALFSGVHPVLNLPFTCVQGTYEYHCHPSHLTDAWDTHRRLLRLPRLLDHLITKAGVPLAPSH